MEASYLEKKKTQAAETAFYAMSYTTPLLGVQAIVFMCKRVVSYNQLLNRSRDKHRGQV